MPLIGFSALLFIVALGLAFVFTPVVRSLARHVGAVDHPDGHRKLHAAPIPKLGGIAVFCAFYAAVALILPFWDEAFGAAAIDLVRRSFVPSLIVLLLGVADDVWGVKPAAKVAVQIVAAAWICWYPDLRIMTLSNPLEATAWGVGILSLPLTIGWIVLITNAFNIVDGIDGLASGVAFVAAACLFVAAIQLPDSFVPVLAAALCGALVGFLRYNFNPASIFLGDAGSLWLGFLIAVFSIAGRNKSSTAVAVAAPLLSLALPLIETCVSMLRRFLRGQAIWEADTGHIHHQLLKRGFTARRAAIVLYAGSGLFGAASLLLGDSNNSNRVVGGVVTLTLVTFAWLGLQQLGYSEFTEVNRAFKRGFFYQRRIIRNSILVRKLADDLRCLKTMTEAWPLLVEIVDQLCFARLQLVLEPSHPYGLARDADRLNPDCPMWVAERAQGVADEDWCMMSVHVVGGGRPAARLDLWRSRSEEPLHSELAVLLDVLAEQLPRLLIGSPSIVDLAHDQLLVESVVSIR